VRSRGQEDVEGEYDAGVKKSRPGDPERQVSATFLFIILQYQLAICASAAVVVIASTAVVTRSMVTVFMGRSPYPVQPKRMSKSTVLCLCGNVALHWFKRIRDHAARVRRGK
jgi:hypothetical protein